MAISLSATDCAQNGPLGMISGDIQDWQITASSTYPLEWDKGCHERYGRLYQPNGYGWCAKFKSSSEWLQVDLGVAAKVGGGRGEGGEGWGWGREEGRTRRSDAPVLASSGVTG